MFEINFLNLHMTKFNFCNLGEVCLEFNFLTIMKDLFSAN